MFKMLLCDILKFCHKHILVRFELTSFAIKSYVLWVLCKKPKKIKKINEEEYGLYY